MTAAAQSDAPDALSAVLDDTRPKVRLPGDNWLLSQTAEALGRSLAGENIFVRNGEAVFLEAGALRPITAQSLRTLAERFVVFYRQRSTGDRTFDIDVSMKLDEASAILASGQFTEQLRRIRQVNDVPLPVRREDDRIELLRTGYDPGAQTLTMSGADYPRTMSLNDAKSVISDLFGEFTFADAQRSRAVSVAALVGFYAQQILPEGSLRPCFVVTKNAEGAGGTCLVSCCVIPILGSMAAGTRPESEDEMRKMLTSYIREGRRVILLDNLKGKLSSAALEAFASASTWTDRLLGQNATYTASNGVTIFATCNGATLTPDMRRRSLIVELHLSEERAEDRVFKRPLDVPTLLKMRPRILAACWAFVRHWDAAGRPAPSRSNSAFHSWATTIGGIVEAAGFGCCLETLGNTADVDEDGRDMRALVAAMQPTRKYTFSEVAALCHENELFAGLTIEPVDHSRRIAFGCLLGRYGARLVGDRHKFFVNGSGHSKRFHVEETAHYAHSAHSLPPSTQSTKTILSRNSVQSVQVCRAGEVSGAPVAISSKPSPFDVEHLGKTVQPDENLEGAL
ncbi:MAG: hypothetical protein ACYCOX_02170 [Acidobacteriaceae bacterium]